MEVPKIMALPIPCKTRAEISQMAFGAIAESKDVTPKISMPYVKILFLPYMSAILPKGTKNMAADRR
jgi:hypothetical protein